MKSPIRPCLLLAALLLLTCSCASEVREANINQNKYIDDYIHSRYPDNDIVRNDEIVRIILVDTLKGVPAIETGDSVYLFIAGATFAQNGPTDIFMIDTTTVRVGKGDLIEGLDKGLVGAHLGEESLILFPSKYGYGRNSVGLVPENTALLFNVAIAAIKKNNKK